ncbi:MAG: HAD family hydrolase [Anaerolineae bacterium]
MAEYPDAARPLVELKARHKFFIGIDSDGCAFDTMEIKHKECFCPNTIKYWNLQGVSKYAREAVEFVNLYSKWRGINRWPALVMVFDLLRERPEVIARKIPITEAKALRTFIESGLPLSNDGLKKYLQKHYHPELEQGLAWSEAVNAAVADMVHGVPPFPYVRESLEMMYEDADMIVVSATPTEALVREWQEHSLDRYIRVIAGQEMGSKTQHLAMAASGKYPSDHILMIGDAPGDMKAAKANNALFYPINPGAENESWERFFKEAYRRFVTGTYAGAYEQLLITEFEARLPEVPPWKR